MTPFQIEFPRDRLDLARSLTCGQVFRWTQDAQGKWHGRDGDARYSIQQIGDQLIGEAWGGAVSVEALLDLAHDDARLIDAINHAAPELHPKPSGIRLIQLSDAVEVAASFLCSANNNLHRILPMVRTLAAPGNRFPDLEALAAWPQSELRAQGFGYRAATLPRAAQEMCARGGEKWLAGLRRLTYEEAYSELLSVPGFGPKLTDCVLLYGLGHTEAFPIDTHVWKALTETLLTKWKGEALTHRRYQETSKWMRDRFGKDAGRVQQLVFVDRLESHGSLRPVKGRGEKISPKLRNAQFEPENNC